MTKLRPPPRLTSPSGSGVSLKRRFFLYSSRPIGFRTIIPAMGRLKIKKKEAVMPFRETMAYRMLLLTLSIAFFIYTLYEMTVSMLANNTLAFIIAVLAGIGAAFAIFYNLDRLKQAKIPSSTA